ncbi:MAG: hypothetical protein HYU37_04855 [Acidobacteria bacterium]|nr:hypothetical protein [Acidobacteriota bacterium]
MIAEATHETPGDQVCRWIAATDAGSNPGYLTSPLETFGAPKRPEALSHDIIREVDGATQTTIGRRRPSEPPLSGYAADSKESAEDANTFLGSSS